MLNKPNNKQRLQQKNFFWHYLLSRLWLLLNLTCCIKKTYEYYETSLVGDYECQLIKIVYYVNQINILIRCCKFDNNRMTIVIFLQH